MGEDKTAACGMMRLGLPAPLRDLEHGARSQWSAQVGARRKVFLEQLLPTASLRRISGSNRPSSKLQLHSAPCRSLALGPGSWQQCSGPPAGLVDRNRPSPRPYPIAESPPSLDRRTHLYKAAGKASSTMRGKLISPARCRSRAAALLVPVK